MSYADVCRSDTLAVVRGAGEKSLADKNRERLGLMPHSKAFEKFLDDKRKHANDPNRSMIGIAVSRYQLWPSLEI